MTESAIRTSTGDVSRPRQNAVGVWLIVIAVLVFAMVMLGGATRLTNSGLSMVHWKFTGSLPPMSAEAWDQEFARYRQFPEYQKINAGMELSEFQRIFWFEYSHRMLGRLIGLAFVLPLLWFSIRKQVDRVLLPKLLVLLALGGLQGLVGWWMVRSGLVDHPDVSHYRLTVHLGLATALFAALIWVAVDVLRQTPAGARGRRADHATFGWIVWVLAFCQILLGGLVAGLNAGLVYNTFPTMGGHWVPPELLPLSLHGLLDEPVAVQFLHRLGAYAVCLCVLGLWWRVRRDQQIDATRRRAADLVLIALVAQVLLGISTLLAGVPLGLALAHQAGALILLAALTYLQHSLSTEPRAH